MRVTAGLKPRPSASTDCEMACSNSRSGWQSGRGLAVVACGGLRKRHELFELSAGGAGIDGFGSEAHAVEKIGGAACCDERASCIGHHDFAMRAMLAVEERAS